MPSVLPGFEYDIFISYRQKDNRGDHWVTEFVNALKTELEATFKEDISIYFDENPHDGLLETHNVDKSLEGKLKCLIFIPIISQTYCDPKSYAWQHEFCAFNRMAIEGTPLSPGEGKGVRPEFGRDIKLSNGNVASRILPIKIHDLDTEDKTLLENELGGVLRPIEFIYHSAGVNRPLNPSDNPDKNLNKTFYRDQINKVANGVKHIIGAMKKSAASPSGDSREAIPSSPLERIIRPNRKRMFTVLSVIVLLMALTGYLLYSFTPLRTLLQPEPKDKSIAVLPFKNIGSDGNDEYFSDGMTEEVINYLAKVKELKVMSRTSVEQYKGGNKDIRSIANELDVSTILEGSVRKAGNKFRISVQLIEAETGFHLWSHEYDKEITDVLQVQSEIAKEVTDALSIVLSANEKQNIESGGQIQTIAYDFYLKARSELLSFQLGTRMDPEVRNKHLQNSISLFKKSIEADPKFSKAYTGLGLTFHQQNFLKNYFNEGFLDSLKILADRSLKLDLQNEEAFFLKGIHYQEDGKFDEAIDEFNKALAINPNYADAIMGLAINQFRIGRDPVIALTLLQKTIEIDRGPGLAGHLRGMGLAYLYLGFNDKAKEFYSRAAPLDGDSSMLYFMKAVMEQDEQNYQAAYNSMSKACVGFSSTPWFCADGRAWQLQLMGKYKESLDVRLRWEENTKNTPAEQLGQMHRTGWLYWQTGNKKKAQGYFDRMIEYGLESIRLNRDYAQFKSAHFDLAGVYAFTGQKEKAYQFLEEFSKVPMVPKWAINNLNWQDPMFGSIRQNALKKLFNKCKRGSMLSTTACSSG